MTRTCDSGARCATSLPKQLEFDGPSRWMVSTLEASTPSPRDYHTWGEGDRPPQCESAAVSLDADSHELVEDAPDLLRSEEHTSELQSPCNLVCRLLLETKNI